MARCGQRQRLTPASGLSGVLCYRVKMWADDTLDLMAYLLNNKWILQHFEAQKTRPEPG